MSLPAPQGAMQGQGAAPQRTGHAVSVTTCPHHCEGCQSWSRPRGGRGRAHPVLTMESPRRHAGSLSRDGCFRESTWMNGGRDSNLGNHPGSQEGPTRVRNSWSRRAGSRAFCEEGLPSGQGLLGAGWQGEIQKLMGPQPHGSRWDPSMFLWSCAFPRSVPLINDPWSAGRSSQSMAMLCSISCQFTGHHDSGSWPGEPVSTHAKPEGVYPRDSLTAKD